MVGVHNRCWRASNLFAAPTGAENTSISIGIDFVVDICESRKIGIHTVVHIDHGSINVAPETVGHRGGPFGVKRTFPVAARGRTVNIDWLDI